MENKFVLINRAVPGSGKSSITKCIVRYAEAIGHQTAVHSTDDFFMTSSGTYAFDPGKLNDYHMQNLADFKQSLRQGIHLVVCDNTNLAPWQTEPYTDAARASGYPILFLDFSPRPLADHIASQQVTHERPDAHGVPEDTLRQMIQEYHTYTPLLDKQTPVDPDQHFHFVWDIKTHQPVRSNRPCKHFDLDSLHRITPGEYHQVKPVIGERILKKMT